MFSSSHQELETTARSYYQSPVRPLNIIQGSSWPQKLGQESLSLRSREHAPEKPSNIVGASYLKGPNFKFNFNSNAVILGIRCLQQIFRVAEVSTGPNLCSKFYSYKDRTPKAGDQYIASDPKLGLSSATQLCPRPNLCCFDGLRPLRAQEIKPRNINVALC